MKLLSHILNVTGQKTDLMQLIFNNTHQSAATSPQHSSHLQTIVTLVGSRLGDDTLALGFLCLWDHGHDMTVWPRGLI